MIDASSPTCDGAQCPHEPAGPGSYSARLPLVPACSACSSAAQTANHVALALDQLGVAEMSCIAGLGGDVKPLVKLAKSGRAVVALDGCARASSRHALARHGVTPDHDVQLQQVGVRTRLHVSFERAEANRIVASVSAPIGHLVAPCGVDSGAASGRVGRRRAESVRGASTT